jgi:hypothetical protein
MQYFQAMGLDPEDPVGLALAYQLDATSLGVFNRHGFVEGWRNLQYIPPLFLLCSVLTRVGVIVYRVWRGR